MDLKLYNTLSAKKEIFTPLDANNVRVYVCGPTVYDHAHIGNARPVIVFDVLYRLLRHRYGKDHVTYVRNITDVDDKINARAAEEGVPISEVTARTTKQFHDDIAALGTLAPDIEPRATDHIEQMKALIERLIENGNAYVAQGHVLFHVPSMPDYGKLSKRSLDEMEAGARVEVAPYKKGPMDFVLWKPSKEGEPSWDSPCGIEEPGRPGWHIECSAMAAEHLGETFDIHGGGVDLVFPHHENEIAQTRCGFGTGLMAQVWMHNGYLQVEGEKMSKSAGNFITLHDLLKEWPGDVLRFQMLMTHYRSPLDWTKARCEEAQCELENWAKLLRGFFKKAYDNEPSNELKNALYEDLNTSEAITVLREHADKARRGDPDAKKKLAQDAKFLGFQKLDQPGLFVNYVSSVDAGPEIHFRHYENVSRLRAAIANNHFQVAESLKSEIQNDNVVIEISDSGRIVLRGNNRKFTEEVEGLIAARNAAREAKNFAEADRIRDELAEMGVALKDGPEGTTWEIAR